MINKLEILRAWSDKSKRLNTTLDELYRLLGVSPESALMSNINDILDAYTTNTAILVGDTEGWLEWYAYETDYGESPATIKHACGTEYLICTPEDLLEHCIKL